MVTSLGLSFRTLGKLFVQELSNASVFETRGIFIFYKGCLIDRNSESIFRYE